MIIAAVSRIVIVLIRATAGIVNSMAVGFTRTVNIAGKHIIEESNVTEENGQNQGTNGIVELKKNCK